MAEYIDVEPVRKQIVEFKTAVEQFVKSSSFLMAYISGIDAVMEIIDELPAADVQKVKHGRWIKTEDFTMIERYAVQEYECSKCGAHAHCGIDNYCYHCGARMDGDENAK